MEKTYEVCPYCGNEVELDAELKVQECPKCHMNIVTCSMCLAVNDCDEPYCQHCCLEYLAHKMNEDKTPEYISLEDIGKKCQVTISNGYILLDCYGIYVKDGLVCANIPSEDFQEFIPYQSGWKNERDEYFMELSHLMNYFNQYSEDGNIMDFVIPISELDNNSSKKIKTIIENYNETEI